MDKKIESWRLYADGDDAWKGEINEYEGAISLEDRDYLFNKLNIYIS